ncbi:hypothetical protein KVT40_005121 [Elsinoe batatas]|uniref:Uncharacterized protein n=1 Tax=Elsinoe batatas TaxID=2601811 RepID=A0A8K0L8F6_9PEZI|nr:hypothetical protein KVT40_005121 [Elsinoe batatas]
MVVHHHRHAMRHRARYYQAKGMPAFSNASVPTTLMLAVEETTGVVVGGSVVVIQTTLGTIGREGGQVQPPSTAQPPSVTAPALTSNATGNSYQDKSYRAVLVAGSVLLTAIGVCLYAWFAIKKKERLRREGRERRRVSAMKEGMGIEGGKGGVEGKEGMDIGEGHLVSKEGIGGKESFEGNFNRGEGGDGQE